MRHISRQICAKTKEPNEPNFIKIGCREVKFNIYLQSLLLEGEIIHPIQHRKIAETLQNNFTETLQYCMVVAKHY